MFDLDFFLSTRSLLKHNAHKSITFLHHYLKFKTGKSHWFNYWASIHGKCGSRMATISRKDCKLDYNRGKIEFQSRKKTREIGFREENWEKGVSIKEEDWGNRILIMKKDWENRISNGEGDWGTRFQSWKKTMGNRISVRKRALRRRKWSFPIFWIATRFVLAMSVFFAPYFNPQ